MKKNAPFVSGESGDEIILGYQARTEMGRQQAHVGRLGKEKRDGVGPGDLSGHDQESLFTGINLEFVSLAAQEESNDGKSLSER